MLLLLALLLMMKIRVGDGWTVVCSKKRQNKKSLKGKNDLGKVGFSILVKRKEVRKKGKGNISVRKAKILKKQFFKKTEVCALAQSCRVLKRLPFSIFVQVPSQ